MRLLLCGGDGGDGSGRMWAEDKGKGCACHGLLATAPLCLWLCSHTSDFRPSCLAAGCLYPSTFCPSLHLIMSLCGTHALHALPHGADRRLAHAGARGGAAAAARDGAAAVAKGAGAVPWYDSGQLAKGGPPPAFAGCCLARPTASVAGSSCWPSLWFLLALPVGKLLHVLACAPVASRGAR